LQVLFELQKFNSTFYTQTATIKPLILSQSLMLQKPPQIMGILNLTPDSFSDGGQFNTLESAYQQAEKLIQEGASIIDLGAESSGPNSTQVSLAEEEARLIPVLKKILPLAQKHQVQISVDTYKSQIADQALNLGVDIINDVTGLRGDPLMAQVIAKHNAKIIIMYSKDSSARTTLEATQYTDVIQTIKEFFDQQIDYATQVGIPYQNIILDPGMGAFISTNPQYSFEILDRLQELQIYDLPILIGTSMKSMHQVPLKDRLAPSIESALLAYQNGASILRVHHIKPHISAIIPPPKSKK